MEQDRLPLEIPVDMSQEEYLRSQELIRKAAQRNNFLGGYVVGVAMLLLCTVMVIVDCVVAKRVDVPTVLLLLLLIAMEVMVWVVNPKTLRNSDIDAYNQTLFTGYTFAGILHIGPVDIRKQTMSSDVSISYLNCPLFVEAEDMMVFAAPRGRGIVVPARFLTAEDAEVLRELAFTHIPPSNRRLMGKLVPTAVEHGPWPRMSPKPEPILYDLNLEYTVKEHRQMVMEGALDILVRTGVNRLMFAALGSLAFYMALGPVSVAVYLLLWLGINLYSLVKPQIKLGRAVRETGGDAQKYMVLLTADSMSVHSKYDAMKSLRYPWSSLTRAVETPETVEFYARRKVLTIPKRCIPDWDEFQRIVDEHMDAARSR